MFIDPAEALDDLEQPSVRNCSPVHRASGLCSTLGRNLPCRLGCARRYFVPEAKTVIALVVHQIEFGVPLIQSKRICIEG
jgi:hypothetical protein